MRRDSSFLCISITIKNGGKILGKNLSFVLNNLEDLVAAFFISITTILVVINIVLRYVLTPALFGLKRLLPAALSGRYLSALLPYSSIAVTLALISLLRECPKVCRRLSA